MQVREQETAGRHVRANDELASLALLDAWETLLLRCECGAEDCNLLVVVALLEYVEARESGGRILAIEHRA